MMFFRWQLLCVTEWIHCADEGFQVWVRECGYNAAEAQCAGGLADLGERCARSDSMDTLKANWCRSLLFVLVAWL